MFFQALAQHAIKIFWNVLSSVVCVHKIIMYCTCLAGLLAHICGRDFVSINFFTVTDEWNIYLIFIILGDKNLLSLIQHNLSQICFANVTVIIINIQWQLVLLGTTLLNINTKEALLGAGGTGGGYACSPSEFQTFACRNCRRSSPHCWNFNTSQAQVMAIIAILSASAVLLFQHGIACQNYTLTEPR